MPLVITVAIENLFRMSFKRFFQIWRLIAAACFGLSLLARVLVSYLESTSGCAAKLKDSHAGSDLNAALLFSAFLFLFFIRAGGKKGIAQAERLLRDRYWRNLRPIGERIPITSAHMIVYVPLAGFCAFTLGVPVFAFVRLRQIAAICGQL